MDDVDGRDRGNADQRQAAYETALRQGANAIVTTAALRAEIASKSSAARVQGRRRVGLLLHRSRRLAVHLQHEHPVAGRADRQGPGRRGGRQQQGQGEHAVREHSRRSRSSAHSVRRSSRPTSSTARRAAMVDRRGADAARERSEPDRLVPAQPPVGQLRGAVGRERARHRPAGGACRLRVCRTSRSSVRAEVRPTSSIWPMARSWRWCRLTTTTSITRWSTRWPATSPAPGPADATTAVDGD